MLSKRLPKVTFFVGAPRSGTTVLFESIFHHEDVAWLPSQWKLLRFACLTGLYFRVFSNSAWHHVRHKRQLRGDPRSSNWRNKVLPGFVEGYDFWQSRFSADMANDFLLDCEPKPLEISRTRAWVSRFLRSSARSYLLHKFTGPARIGFLRAAFPEALFIHLIRDPVAVTNSLLNVPFWQKGGGLIQPWWNGVPEMYLDIYRERPLPEVLALVQWKAIVDLARREAEALIEDRYLEIRYEEFVSDPEAVVSRILDWTGLGPSERVVSASNQRLVRDRNAEAKRTVEAEVVANVEWALSRL